MILENEFEYHLLSHLIGMPDKVLAQKLELLIWPNSPIPDAKVLKALCELVELSTGQEHLTELLEHYVKDSGKEFMENSELTGQDVGTVGPRRGEWLTMFQSLGFVIGRLKEQPEEHWPQLATALTPIAALFAAEAAK